MNDCRIFRRGMLLMIMLSLAGIAPALRITNVYPLDESYYRKDRLVADLTDLAENNSSFVKLHVIGTTKAGNNPLYALQFQTGTERLPVLIIGQHHGEEVLGLEIAMAFAKQLVSDVGTPEISELLNKYSFWIIPTLNPDAWEIVSAGIYQCKRKNSSDNSKNNRLNYATDGVDLNRNYPQFWAFETNYPENSPYYKGPFPASEIEIKAIIDLASRVDFRFVFSYHSSMTGTLAEKIYLPRQNKKDKTQLQDFREMQRLAHNYASSVPRDYDHGTYGVYKGITSRVGNARNYFYYVKHAYAFDIEVGGVNDLGMGIIQPREDMLETIVRKNIQALITTLLPAE
jgi:hypothetical protein